MKTLQEQDLIYLAGFIDADGSIIAQIVKKSDYRFKYQIRLTFQVTQLTKRRWLLESFKELIGAGTIRTRKGGSVSDYVLVEAANVAAILRQIRPFLRVKKKQADLVLRIIEQLPSAKESLEQFYQVCKLTDQVSSLNDSKVKTNTYESVKATLSGNDNVPVPVETSDEALSEESDEG
jgi:hypothetical protein